MGAGNVRAGGASLRLANHLLRRISTGGGGRGRWRGCRDILLRPGARVMDLRVEQAISYCFGTWGGTRVNRKRFLPSDAGGRGPKLAGFG